MDYDIGIIGGGAAGLTVAAGAGRLGARTILFDKAGRLGGDCLYSGCVPSKALIRSASVWAEASAAADYGLPALERPNVDLGLVMDRVGEVIRRIGEKDSAERFSSLGVDVVFGSPSFTDSHTVECGGKRVSAKRWVIATGSRPVAPPVEGLEETGYWTNETVFSQRVLPARLAVVGGGPVGLELAQAFARLGSKVTVLEFLPEILAAEDPDITDVVAQRLAMEGVSLLRSAKVAKAGRTGSTVTLTISTPETTRESEFEAVLVAAGRAPNLTGLALDKAGVGFTPRGIPTDARMKTNVGHIYACGDVNGQYPFTHVAGQEGSVALTNIAFRLPRRIDYGLTPWVIYTDPEIAGVGLNEKEAAKRNIPFRVVEERFADNDRAVADGRADGKIKLILSPRGKLLGCRIVGRRAGELIVEWVEAMSADVGLSTISQMMHPYPGYAEISRRAAGSWYAPRLFSERTRKLLRLISGFRGRGPSI